MQNDDIAIKLGRKLKEIFDNDGFILSVLTYADDSKDQQKILDFIEAGDDVSVETISVLAMDLSDARK